MKLQLQIFCLKRGSQNGLFGISPDAKLLGTGTFSEDTRWKPILLKEYERDYFLLFLICNKQYICKFL